QAAPRREGGAGETSPRLHGDLEARRGRAQEATWVLRTCRRGLQTPYDIEILRRTLDTGHHRRLVRIDHESAREPRILPGSSDAGARQETAEQLLPRTVLRPLRPHLRSRPTACRHSARADRNAAETLFGRLSPVSRAHPLKLLDHFKGNTAEAAQALE